MTKEWKFTGIIRCDGGSCHEFPSCAGDINQGFEFGCEIELEGEVIEVKEDYPIKRKLPVM